MKGNKKWLIALVAALAAVVEVISPGVLPVEFDVAPTDFVDEAPLDQAA